MIDLLPYTCVVQLISLCPSWATLSPYGCQDLKKKKNLANDRQEPCTTQHGPMAHWSSARQPWTERYPPPPTIHPLMPSSTAYNTAATIMNWYILILEVLRQEATQNEGGNGVKTQFYKAQAGNG